MRGILNLIQSNFNIVRARARRFQCYLQEACTYGDLEHIRTRKACRDPKATVETTVHLTEEPFLFAPGFYTTRPVPFDRASKTTIETVLKFLEMTPGYDVAKLKIL